MRGSGAPRTTGTSWSTSRPTQAVGLPRWKKCTLLIGWQTFQRGSQGVLLFNWQLSVENAKASSMATALVNQIDAEMLFFFQATY